MSKTSRTIGSLVVYVLIVLLVVVILPAILLSVLPDQEVESIPKEVEQPVQKSGQTISVYNETTGKIMEMDVEEYLVGVVAAEMPAAFHENALEAQAIAARTYAYRKLETPNPKVKEKHPDADITTSHVTCQAWISPEERQKRWGKNYEAYNRKIHQAAAKTANQVIYYEGKLIDPLYHSSCGGTKTEWAKNVWGGDLPYLKSVSCTNHRDKHYGEEKTLTVAQIDQSLGCDLSAVPVSQMKGSGGPIKALDTTESDRIDTISFAGTKLKGTDVRSRLQLKSTLFTWNISGDEITFTTKGYGHGVGMCQYGADSMAQQGKSGKEIVEHYYSGTAVQVVKSK